MISLNSKPRNQSSIKSIYISERMKRVIETVDSSMTEYGFFLFLPNIFDIYNEIPFETNF